MSKGFIETGANIGNYNELNKVASATGKSLWLSPGADQYGLPTLHLQPLVSEENLSPKKTSNVKPERLVVKDHSDRNFLIGTFIAALLLIFGVFLFHQTSYTEAKPKEFLSNEAPAFNQSRLNHSPESVLVRNEISPEFIPGIKKEEEVATCALIVGSFSRKGNAIEMQQQVLSAGYSLYTEEFHEFIRVGVSIPCSEIKGATFTEIEAALGIDPWLRISF